MALERRLDRHPPQVDGRAPRPVWGRLGAEAGHDQDRPGVVGVAHRQVERSRPGVFGEDDGRAGPSVPQDPPPEVVGRLRRYLLDPHEVRRG